MAIIKPARKFIGSDMTTGGGGGKYIREEIRQVIFNKTTNKDGVHVYFLPAYKLDANGDGVWFRVTKVRDNFGDKFKDKYVVGPNDPTAHFERQFKIQYPDDAVVTDEMNDKLGRTMKRYPNYGRETKRVLFNVAYVDDLEKGCHILDLPLYNGATILQKWQEGKDARGRERPQLNDHKKCLPVFLKLNDGGGSPWEIIPDATDPFALPDQLADSEYLYNLDEVFVQKTNAEIIGKLKEMFSPEVFERCMAGYAGMDAKPASRSNPVEAEAPVPSPARKPAAKSAPAVLNIPKVNQKSAPKDDDEEPVEKERRNADDGDTNPLAIQDASLAEFLES